MSNQSRTDNQPCEYFHFGLIVTGKGEHQYLSSLFKTLMALGICNFKVIGFAGQRGPITSQNRKLKMIGSGKTIPTEDEKVIGIPARKHLSDHACAYVILVDDLEHDRRPQAQQIFARYRKAFDTMLGVQKHRASVHFLVNMLEAYFFADARGVNTALHLSPSLEDYPGDVETIRHPKNDLIILYPSYREIEDGGKILDALDLEHVLSRPETCASLRTIFAWCAKVLEQYPYYAQLALSDKYHLRDGCLSAVTGSQLLSI